MSGDNGIVTCFYAWYYPEAEVVGVDINKPGIECARNWPAVLVEERDSSNRMSAVWASPPTRAISGSSLRYAR